MAPKSQDHTVLLVDDHHCTVHSDVFAVSSGVASYGALGHMPSRLLTVSCLVHFGVKLTANYPSIM